MFVTGVTETNTIGALEKTLAFTEARNKVLAENIANVTTPEYRAKQLDPAEFQAALRSAIDKRCESNEPLRLESTEQFHQDEMGFLKVTPTDKPPENLLFHDGTNARIEKQMAMLAENTLMNKVAAELLRNQFEGLGKAIRGRAG